ncbi:MAG: 16S rRNA (cytosine(967)-C(5))-methyltransferase RsmB [Defluviitaleaceae bacterium]|nr:16S rRNA (cytosine(967)-C(5))-methyltransferase RsmB [Defluviitaleaceae bacterium]
MRNVALAVLMEVTENAAYANIALRKALGTGGSDARDRAFVTELVNETLRNLGFIDTVINHFSTLPVDMMKPSIRNLLRMSVCQLRVLTKIPPHAAVHEAVELAKSQGFAKLSGFVNGVLRSIVRKPNEPELPEGDWVVRYSYPEALAADLIHWLGEERAEEFARNSHAIPSVTVYANTTKLCSDNNSEYDFGEEINGETLGGGFRTLRNAGDITALQAFKNGLFFVMDPGAMWAVHALGLKPTDTLFDMCAAPGGKSFAAACVMGGAGEITAMDIHPHRVQLMDKTIRRLGLKSIKTKVGDGTNPSYNNKYDAVLLDAPCSGLGTLRKRPEIKYRYDGPDPTLLETQRALLESAATYVKPGGTLVYSTCTVTREENIDRVRQFCKEHPSFTIEPLPMLPDEKTIPHFVEDNCLQLLPGEYNDGFFIARLRYNEKNNEREEQ